jgi:hypothetical protein
MQRHLLSLRYDGLRATEGELGTSVSKQVIQGAQIFLGAHAHYYLSGAVPDRINDRTTGFEITQASRAKGSHVADFLINFVSNGAYDLAKFGFELFVLHSLMAWHNKELVSHPHLERIEPYFEVPHSNRPFIDEEAERHGQRVRLYRRVGQAMAYMTAPIGSSASTMDLSFDGKPIQTYGRRFYSEEEVVEAVLQLRDKLAPRGRLT